MVLSLISLALMAQQAPLSCPAMGSPISGKPAEVFDYAGARYGTCCAGCEDAFKKDPAKTLAQWAEKGTTIGMSLFDPISGTRVEPKDAKAFADYKGIRYPFAKEDEKATFDADPKKYGAVPKKEALFCPVLKTDLKTYDGAHGFVDYKGVRYYTCCEDCLAKLKANPETYVSNAEGQVKEPAVTEVKG